LTASAPGAARATGRLARILAGGGFAVTAEVVPPASADLGAVTDQARALVGYADAANVTDNPRSSAHMSSLAGVAAVAAAGVEPIVQLTCRDRNRLALTADLLGAWALGARAVLCLTGDPVSAGDHPDAAEVHDLAVTDLVRLAVRLRDEGRLLSGAPVDPAPRYLVGVADVPLARPYDPGRLERKLDAGADFVQTQIVFDVEGLAEWADGARARGVFERARVIVGIAPLRSARQARYLDEHLPGVVVPPELVRALEEAGPEAEATGVRLAVATLERLRVVQGIAGVHVMGLGREDAVRRVIEAAGLVPRPTLAGAQPRSSIGT
jgi:methylenetetrahydrofolate reductase (NADPH)